MFTCFRNHYLSPKMFRHQYLRVHSPRQKPNSMQKWYFMPPRCCVPLLKRSRKDSVSPTSSESLVPRSRQYRARLLIREESNFHAFIAPDKSASGVVAFHRRRCSRTTIIGLMITRRVSVCLADNTETISTITKDWNYIVQRLMEARDENKAGGRVNPTVPAACLHRFALA